MVCSGKCESGHENACRALPLHTYSECVCATFALQCNQYQRIQQFVLIVVYCVCAGLCVCMYVCLSVCVCFIVTVTVATVCLPGSRHCMRVC